MAQRTVALCDGKYIGMQWIERQVMNIAGGSGKENSLVGDSDYQADVS